MKRLLVVLAVVLAVAASSASTAQASVLGCQLDQKYELSMDGFGYLKEVDPDGTPGSCDEYLVLRNLVKIDSPIKAQGNINTATDEPAGAPDRFYTGYDNGLGGRLSNPGPDVYFSGVLGALMTGLKVIAVDDDAGGPFAGPWTRLTDPHDIIAWSKGLLGQPDPWDVIHFGAEDEDVTPLVKFYNDTTVLDGDFGPGHDGWNAVGDLYTAQDGDDIGEGGTNDAKLLTATLQNIGLHYVDGLNLIAPAGTLVSNVLDPNGAVRPLVFMDVVRNPVDSPEMVCVLPGGMWATLYDSAGNPQTFVADIISAVGSQPMPGFAPEAWVTLSDPTEYVGGIPEPGSVVIWGALGLVGLAYCRLRRRR
jgi:hypothetical protein